MNESLINAGAAAKILGCTVASVYNWTRSGKLSCVIVPNPGGGPKEIKMYQIDMVNDLANTLHSIPDGLLDRFQVTEMLRCSDRTVYALGDQGKLPYCEVHRFDNKTGWHKARMYPSAAVEKLSDELWGPIHIADSWGYWFSGLADGEGSFSIRIRPDGLPANTAFALTLRDDDGQVIYDIKQTLGIGRIYHGGIDEFLARNGKMYKANPRLQFQVCSFHECYKLTTVFDKYPLRSKKSRDYIIWKDALVEFMLPFRSRNWLRLKKLASQIVSIKEYSSSDVTTLSGM